MLHNHHGFSLVEVVASIVLLGIILLSFGQLIIQSNSTALANNDKLVVIHLVDATLERLKIENHIVKEAYEKTEPQSGTSPCWKDINLTNYSLSQINVNETNYIVTACITEESASVLNLGLVNVLVEIEDEHGKRKSDIEGFVKL